MKLILGSSSNPRQKIFADMGYEFEVMSPDIDERAIRDPDPKKLVLMVARAKADDIIKRAGNGAIVITGDSVAIRTRPDFTGRRIGCHVRFAERADQEITQASWVWSWIIGRIYTYGHMDGEIR